MDLYIFLVIVKRMMNYVMNNKILFLENFLTVQSKIL